MTKLKNSENSIEIKDGLFLCCLCGKHKKDSTCEVYLRTIGKWDEEKESEKSMKEILKWLRDHEDNNKVAEPYKPMYPQYQPYYPPTYPTTPNYTCTFCGMWVIGGSWHNCNPNKPIYY